METNDDRPWHLTTRLDFAWGDRWRVLFGWPVFVRFYTPDGQCHAACQIAGVVQRDWPPAPPKTPGIGAFGRIGAAVVLLLALAATAAATPFTTASLGGCVAAADVPPLVFWSASAHVETGAFHDLLPGCDPTIEIPHSYLEIFETPTFETVHFAIGSLGERCGRYQFDVGTGDALKSLVVDFGVPCVSLPPIGRPPDGPTPTPTPEPATDVGVGLGLLGLAWTRIRRRR